MNLVEIVFDYVNERINEEKLIEELNIYIKSIKDKNLKEKVNVLLDSIKKINQTYNSDILKYKEIYSLLVNNEDYIEEAKKMSNKDLMLMLTKYLRCSTYPSINQNLFDKLVDEAINYKECKEEKCFRLAMTYDNSGLSLEKIENYLIDNREYFYVLELMCACDSLDKDKTIEKIIKTKDKKFISNILKDEISVLENKHKERLKDKLK